MTAQFEWEYRTVTLKVSEAAINAVISEGWQYVGLKPLPPGEGSRTSTMAEVIFKRPMLEQI
ncbi:MAG: DUF4177 domain-containing protein [Chloroflexota bacterium]|nr:DUF4177 domain-containing protein [Chloroflexota bacterium]